jgi:hypothetical protein
MILAWSAIRVRPGRFRFSNPAIPKVAYRDRQRFTVGLPIPTRAAISYFATPSEASSTRARLARPTGAIVEWISRSSFGLSPTLARRSARAHVDVKMLLRPGCGALRAELNGSVMTAWVGDDVIGGVRGAGAPARDVGGR